MRKRNMWTGRKEREHSWFGRSHWIESKGG